VGDVAERLVTGAVTAALVVFRELVEVADEDGEGAVESTRAFEFLVKALVQVAMVVQPRKSVGDSVELDPAHAYDGRLQHRGEGRPRVGRQRLAGAPCDGRQVGGRGGDDVALGVTDGRQARHPHAVLVGVKDVDVRDATVEGESEVVVGEDLVAEV